MKVCVPLADGFEEIEAITIIDVLRRANISVLVASLDVELVQGSHGVTVKADTKITNVNADDIDMLVLPGGLPGATNLAKDKTVQSLLKEMDKKNKNIGAICAAPYALKTAGVLKNQYTAYPGWEENIQHAGYRNDLKVVEDANIITSMGPGTAICFALSIVKKIKGENVFNKLKAELLADYC